MSITPRLRLRRQLRRRRNGQSIPIIALMLLVLVAMVGLSVDVGNTFSHEREAVSASNAASISAMTTYLKKGSGTGGGNAVTNQAVYKSIKDSLDQNGITVGDGTNGTMQLAATYMNARGEPITSPAAILESDSSAVPANVGFIQVTLNGKVDTSFARVVGRPDLPINAEAYAGTCAVTSGVYPLGVPLDTITDDHFNSNGLSTPVSPTNYGTVSSGTFEGFKYRRIYVKDGIAGSFSWLRWMESSGVDGTSSRSNQALTASLQGDGNIDAGYEEATWPAGFSAISKPTVYPPEPGNLGEGDWVWGVKGWKASNAVDAVLTSFKTNQTRLILPIYKYILADHGDVKAYVAKLGSFVIIGKSNRGGANAYFDMVYLGDPVKQYTACSASPPEPADNTLAMDGTVAFYPAYKTAASQKNPIKYVVVLDASGSMSATFNGLCDTFKGSTLAPPVQCTNGPNGLAPAVDGTGVDYWWSNEKQRRIYVAKKALNRLVSLTNMSGNTGYTNLRPDDKMAVVWFTGDVPTGNVQSFSSNPTTLTDFINNANSANGMYRSQGGTNGAGGLQRASELYSSGPESKFTYNGQDWTYKRVVLFITDGVSNVFLDTGRSNLNGGVSDAPTFPADTYCRGLGPAVKDTPLCQITETSGSATPERPISQMINVSKALRNRDVTIFVLALSSIQSDALRDSVATSSSYFNSAEDLTILDAATGKTNVDDTIEKINTTVEDPTCTAGESGSSITKILGTEFTPSGSYSYADRVGMVALTNGTTTLTAWIKAGTDGTLSFNFPKLSPGTYTVNVNLYYTSPIDKTSRVYDLILDGGTARETSTFTVVRDSGFANKAKQLDLVLKQGANVCATTN